MRAPTGRGVQGGKAINIRSSENDSDLACFHKIFYISMRF